MPRTLPAAALVPALCRVHGLPEPAAEWKFALPRRWAFDFAWVPDSADGNDCPGVALEIEGGLFGVGRPCPACHRRGVGGHSSIQRLKSDAEKYNEAAIRGWCVIRCLPDQIAAGQWVGLVRRALEGRG